MRRNHRIFIKVTRDEKQELISKAARFGFPTLTSYMRWCALSNVLEDLQELKFLLKKNG
jgi:uncharacterized protein (DUF1778 family)